MNATEKDELIDSFMCSLKNKNQKVPIHTLDALKRYVEHGIPPGGFLIAVLSNDLKRAFSRADDINIANMYAIVKYIYNNIPSKAWGSPERVSEWINSFKKTKA